jgi:hypothetical protein
MHAGASLMDLFATTDNQRLVTIPTERTGSTAFANVPDWIIPIPWIFLACRQQGIFSAPIEVRTH